jgi:hypothetical protein
MHGGSSPLIPEGHDRLGHSLPDRLLGSKFATRQ